MRKRKTGGAGPYADPEDDPAPDCYTVKHIPDQQGEKLRVRHYESREARGFHCEVFVRRDDGEGDDFAALWRAHHLIEAGHAR